MEGSMLMLTSPFICITLFMCSKGWTMNMNGPGGHEDQYTCALLLIIIFRHSSGKWFYNPIKGGTEEKSQSVWSASSILLLLIWSRRNLFSIPEQNISQAV